MHNIKLCVDRIEENTVVAFSDDGTKHIFSKNNFCINEGDVILATIDTDGTVIDISPLSIDTEKAKDSISKKLKKLFKK